MQTTISSTNPDLSREKESQIKHHLFIGGCSRSGTTLLGAMLGAHPQAICTPESHFKIELLRHVWPNIQTTNPSKTLALLTKHWRYKLWGLDASAQDLARQANNASFGEMLNTIGLTYAKTQNKPEVDMWIDHTPENISYTQSLLAIYPNAKFVHIVRDGRAVASSIIPLDWGPNSIIKAARWWMRMTSFGLAAELSLSPEQIMRIKYEDLIQDPKATIEKLCQFLNIDFHESMLDATGFNPPKYTTRQHQLVGRKPNAGMLTKWRERLSKRQIEIFENQTRDFLNHLGYEPDFGLNSRGPSFMEVQRGKAVELLRGEFTNKVEWLIRSYPLWLTKDFYTFAKLSDSNN